MTLEFVILSCWSRCFKHQIWEDSTRTRDPPYSFPQEKLKIFTTLTTLSSEAKSRAGPERSAGESSQSGNHDASVFLRFHLVCFGPKECSGNGAIRAPLTCASPLPASCKVRTVIVVLLFLQKETHEREDPASNTRFLWASERETKGRKIIQQELNFHHVQLFRNRLCLKSGLSR